MRLVALLILAFLVACDDSNSSIGVESAADESSTGSESGSSLQFSNTDYEDDGLISSNPIPTRTETFGVDGNLYKPVADDHGAGAGNLVVLLGSKFTEAFDSCEVTLNTGEVRQLVCIDDQPWTHIPYSCFANGDRQHWRADFKCSAMSEVKVTCREEKQEVVFTAPAGRGHELCSRFG